jgi:mannose-6-phosphate isomerase-like protein (cupin superfamily)
MRRPVALLALVPILGVASAVVVGTQVDAAPQRLIRPEGYKPMYELLGKRPETSEPYLRAWWAHRGPTMGASYAVVPRRIPMHVHLDADHLLVVIEGYAVATLGGRTAEMSPGDVLAVPRGMAHELTRQGWDRLVVLDVSSPPGDMSRTFWIEEPKAK